MIMDKQEFLTHIPDIGPEEEAYCHEVMPHYLIYRRVNRKEAEVHCTYCRKTYRIPAQEIYHNKSMACPQCGRMTMAKAAGYAKNLQDRLYFVYFSKSKADPDAITAKGIYAIRQMPKGEEFPPVPCTSLVTEDAYLFRIGEKTEHYQYSWWRIAPGYRGFHAANIYRVKAIRDRSGANGLKTIPNYASFPSLAWAVKGTTWERFFGKIRLDRSELLVYLDLCARHPCIEYFVKMGLSGLLDAYFYGAGSYNAINWRGKTPQKILRLPMKDIKLLAASGKADCELLRLMQIDRAHAGNLSVKQLEWFSMYYVDKMLELGSWQEMTKYILLQKKPAGNVICDLHDYWRQCETLGMDLTKSTVKWPQDLQRAHELTAKAIKIKADAASNAMITQAVRALGDVYTYSNAELMIRPAFSTEELIKEGQTLNHCVASYAKRYAAGEITICVIRKCDTPDEPYYTAEFRKDGTLAQCRGYRNCNMTPEVKAFMDAIKPHIKTALRRKAA